MLCIFVAEGLMRYLLYILPVILIACNIPQQPKPEEDKTGANASSGKKASFSIIAVGDMMLGTDFPDKSRFPDKNILQSLTDTLKDADFTIGNLEGVLAQSHLRSVKCNGLSNCYAFRSPMHFADYFKNAGFDFLSIANNHSGDFGDEGLRQTMQVLDRAGIKYAGIKKECEAVVLDNGSIKFGIIGVGHGSRHLHINDYAGIREQIQGLKEKADIVAVFFHGGAEGAAAESVTRKPEIFFNENRGNVYEMAHMAVDAGADLVIGSGPHVTRAMELYKNKLIAYSLGNFATYGKISVRGAMGIAPVLKINLSGNGDFLGGRIISTFQREKDASTPLIDPSKAVIRKIISLNAKDFPHNHLAISPAGILTIKNF